MSNMTLGCRANFLKLPEQTQKIADLLANKIRSNRNEVLRRVLLDVKTIMFEDSQPLDRSKKRSQTGTSAVFIGHLY